MKKKMKNKMKSDFSKTLFPSPLSKPFFESLLHLPLMRRPLRRCDGSPCEHAPRDLRPAAAFSAGKKANKFAKKRIEAKEIELKQRKKEIT